MEFLDLCDKLLHNWAEKKLSCWNAVVKRLDLRTEYMPEPYLLFNGDDPNAGLCILTTNPGQSIPMQRRDCIPNRFLVGDYKNVAREVAKIYQCTDGEAAYQEGERLGWKCAQPISPNARRRIEKMREIAGGGSVVQIELIPFHSENLPGKTKAAALAEKKGH